jgi:hypothetical protein
MTKPTIKIVNAETGDEVIREMNAEELNQLELDKARVALKNQEQEQLLVAKELVQAKLAALGLTKDDFKALGL